MKKEARKEALKKMAKKNKYSNGGYDDSDFSDYEKKVARKQRKDRKYTFVRPGDEKSNEEKRDNFFESLRKKFKK